jgi:hypothetical protein
MMTHTIPTRKRKRRVKPSYPKPFNSNIIAYILFAVLALFIVLVRLFG